MLTRQAIKINKDSILNFDKHALELCRKVNKGEFIF